MYIKLLQMTSVNLKLSITQNISPKNQTLSLLKIRALNITLLWKSKNVRNSKNYNFLIVINYCNLMTDYKIVFRKRNMRALHVKLLQNLSLRIFRKHIKSFCFDKRNNNLTVENAIIQKSWKWTLNIANILKNSK